MANAVQRWIIGNWKMHGDKTFAKGFASRLCSHASLKNMHVQVVLCPPATLLYTLRDAIGRSSVKIGAQDCHAEAEGAFTGDVSARMIKDAGTEFVILGHSERRMGHGETSPQVKRKAEAALTAKLTPIICVGETFAQRESGKAHDIVKAQVTESVPQGGCIIAYEPVWAIGSGKTPTQDDIEDMHTYIMQLLGGACPVIYGGSVKAGNAREILHSKHVSGVLVGGASLNAEEFCAIIEAAM